MRVKAWRKVTIECSDGKVHRLLLYRLTKGRLAMKYNGKRQPTVTATEIGRRLGCWLSPK